MTELERQIKETTKQIKRITKEAERDLKKNLKESRETLKLADSLIDLIGSDDYFTSPKKLEKVDRILGCR